MKGTKIVVVGLDGATWDLLEPWSLEGKLPNLKELMKESCWGTLKSTIPPSTAPAWTSLSTGKNPGKHGVFDFVRLEGSSLRFLTSRDIRADPIYDILSKKGLRNVVIGLPLSFPPSEDFNGIMISNWLYPKKRVFPQTMKDLIKEYRVIPNVLKKGEDLLEDIIGTARSQVKVAKKLFLREKWDFYFFYYPETDLTFHKFWNDIKNSTSLGKKAIRVFQIIDEFVGWLLDHMDEKTYLFLVSDHGFDDCPLAICLNLVLAKKGLLRIKLERVSEANQDLSPALKLACRKMKIISIPKPLFELATHPLIKPVSKMLFKSIFGEESFINFMKKVEFENSRAFVPTSTTMGIFVREPDETKKKRTIKDLVLMLKDLKYKD
ncbi:MAG TPA: hypothetical protein EYP29_02195, partial [Thermoplasmata archaeon]|nr:hypothetical protein [Thermoplasmata archaeon]